jgi:hypothetical protein
MYRRLIFQPPLRHQRSRPPGGGSLSFPGALIPKADATLALQLILSQLRIPVDERVLDFQTDQIVQSTFCEALETLAGSDLGWRTMTQIYERELWRADHQS